MAENDKVVEKKEIRHRNKRKIKKPDKWFLVPFWAFGLIIVEILRLPLNAFLEVFDWIMNIIKIILGTQLIVRLLRLLLAISILIGFGYVLLRLTGNDHIIAKIIELIELIVGV